MQMSNPVFTPWVDEHEASLYRFALSLARREVEACDRVQQPFYFWATKGEALREATKAKSWLFVGYSACLTTSGISSTDSNSSFNSDGSS